jgi:hypothetical protein
MIYTKTKLFCYKTGATYFNDIKEPYTIFVSTQNYDKIRQHFLKCDSYDGLLLPELNENDFDEDTNYEDILKKHL